MAATLLSGMPTGVGDAMQIDQVAFEDAASQSWEKVVGLLQRVIAHVEQRALQLEPGGESDGVLSAEVANHISVISHAGDADLLEEVALDLVTCSMRRRVLPSFWSHVDSSVGFDDRWQCGLLCLRYVHATHASLLESLGTSACHRVVGQYYAAFRTAFQSSWPADFSQKLTDYFQTTWRAHQRLFGKSWRGDSSMDSFDSAEWWWRPRSQISSISVLGPVDRVLKLLDPTRRPRSGAEENDADMPQAGDQVLDEEQAGSEDEGTFAFSDQESVDDLEDDEEEDDGLSHGGNDDAVEMRFRSVAVLLRQLGLSRIWHDLVAQFLTAELTRTVEARCQREYDSRGLLRQLTVFLYSPFLRWLRTAHGLPVVAELVVKPADLEAETAWWIAARRVVLHFFEAFVEVRIREAFDMVRDFPESAPALMDLRRCLARTGQTAPLVAALRQQLGRRLLIAGAHTRDVIKVYIKTIKAMRLVDPRGLLLEAVSAPIRAHLRRRKDTVRCIVMAFTEDTDLQVELQAGVAPTASSGSAGGDGKGGSRGAAARSGLADAGGAEPFDLAFGGAVHDASDEEEDPDAWTPDPIDADPLIPSRQRRAQDPISLLVGIYGSKETFIKEYKEMLADRLLSAPSYTTDKETQNLELLKTRFGEAALVHCEVMLQDIKDSKRTNLNVQELAKKTHVEKQKPPQQHAQSQENKESTPLQPQHLKPSAVGGPPDPRGRPFMAPFSLSSIFGSTPTAGGNENAGDAQTPQPAVPPASSASPDGTNAAAANASDKLSVDCMQPLILSQHYWPGALAKADHPHFRLPDAMEDALTEYAAAYAETRKKRSLQWKRAHGLVEITVQLTDRAITALVTPVHLAVLACFNDSDNPGSPVSPGSTAPTRLSLQEVASRLTLPEALARKRIGYWVSKGVLREVTAGVFAVQESLSAADSAAVGPSGAVGSGSGRGSGHHLDETDEHSPGQRAGSGGGGGQCAAEMEACVAFIKGMLTNYSALPLARIHHFLQMFMRDPSYTQTEVQLRDLLARLCQEGSLEFNGSEYTLARKG